MSRFAKGIKEKMQEMGRTRSGGPRLCADRSGAVHEVQWTSALHRPEWNVDDLEPMVSSHALLIERKKVGLLTYLFLSIMQEMGLEPTRYCYHWHLKPARLPFHHSCKHCYDTILYLKSKEKNIPIDHLTLTVLYLFHRKNTWRSLLWVTLLFLS